jgi:aminoglycoside phosphotransferase (APT) family kinase protein
MDAPAAEIDVTAELVDRLVRTQHPDLAGPVRLVANGWDNALFRLGDHLSVRLPRRELAVQLTRHEQRWLPGLAARLPVPVPAPVRAGTPAHGYPWPWTIVPWYDGTLATDVSPAARVSIAPALADFLVRLHVPAPPDAPVNPVRGVPLSHRDEVVRARLDALEDRKRLREVWERAVGLPGWAGPPVWLHGDPHPANLLLTDDDAVGLAAVLDFGDMAGGDPATDLAAGWMVFDVVGRAEFRATVGPDEDTWGRARGWALCMGSAMVSSSDDDPRIAAIGRHTLEQVLLSE